MFISLRMLFIGFFLCFFALGNAQNQPVKDSVYHKIEDFSKDKKFFRFFHRLLFRKTPDTEKKEKLTPKISNSEHQDKIIRNILIETIDPLGNPNRDKNTTTKWYDELGNKIHIKSKDFTIKGYLLFKEKDKINTQKLSESERLLRRMDFINRAEISVIDSTSTKDSADISIRVVDSWSLHPMLTYSGNTIGSNLTEANFLGLGHKLSLDYRNDIKTKQQYRLANYSAYNIYGTFINASISGEKDFDQNENIYLKGNRNFVSPLTRWAGGLYLEYYKKNVKIPTSAEPKDFPKATIKVHHQDFWGGYQFRIKHRNESITENIGFATRFENFAYVDALNQSIDPSRFFLSYHLFLGSVTYAQQKYKIERYVFKHNLPEDIPYGKNITLTTGLGRIDGVSIPYAGSSVSFGFFNQWGYFNIKNEFGSFFKNGKNLRTTFRLDGTYFTPLQDWKFANVRHFFSPTIVLGRQRSPSYVDRTNLTAYNEFPAFDTNYIGRDKLILRYQLQLFVKKSWKNFHYNPYFITTLGWLSRAEKGLFSSPTHTKFGVGVSIYNPYLSFNRFQISFVYYPSVPFDNASSFDFNGYKNYHIPLPNFAIDKPSITDYGNIVYGD